LSYTHALKGFVAVLTVPNESSNSSSLKIIPIFLSFNFSGCSQSNLNLLLDASAQVINVFRYLFVLFSKSSTNIVKTPPHFLSSRVSD
jgi:hypothetical protein